jgi:hypothetical protein
MRTITAAAHASMRRTGLIAGLDLLLMAVLAGLATFGVLERVDPLAGVSDPTRIRNNDLESRS